MNSRAAKRTRAAVTRGFTLIELAAVLAVVSLIAMLATSLLFALMQQQSAMRQQLLFGASQTRLARRFRQDVQWAESYEIGDAGLALRGPGRHIMYVRTPLGALRRTERVGSSSRYDDFDLQAVHEVRFGSETIGDRTVLTLVARPPRATPPHTVSAVGMTTVAELSRTHRWRERP